ncbi:hypothetical protein AB1Y20_017302 [Prymnesium parvum]|uniref:Uncharacterized protein n=1 Tax=Prymnesium parvum TaxID=97485 RepID=A0AB34JMU6_PRYPA
MSRRAATAEAATASRKGGRSVAQPPLAGRPYAMLGPGEQQMLHHALQLRQKELMWRVREEVLRWYEAPSLPLVPAVHPACGLVATHPYPHPAFPPSWNGAPQLWHPAPRPEASPAEADLATQQLPPLAPSLRSRLHLLGLEQTEVALRRAGLTHETLLCRHSPASLRALLERNGDRLPLHDAARILGRTAAAEEAAGGFALGVPADPLPPFSGSQPLRSSPSQRVPITATPAQADRYSRLLPQLSPELKARLKQLNLEQIEIALRRASIVDEGQLQQYSPNSLRAELERNGDCLPLRCATALLAPFSVYVGATPRVASPAHGTATKGRGGSMASVEVIAEGGRSLRAVRSPGKKTKSSPGTVLARR